MSQKHFIGFVQDEIYIKLEHISVTGYAQIFRFICRIRKDGFAHYEGLRITGTKAKISNIRFAGGFSETGSMFLIDPLKDKDMEKILNEFLKDFSLTLSFES